MGLARCRQAGAWCRCALGAAQELECALEGHGLLPSRRRRETTPREDVPRERKRRDALTRSPLPPPPPPRRYGRRHDHRRQGEDALFGSTRLAADRGTLTAAHGAPSASPDPRARPAANARRLPSFLPPWRRAFFPSASDFGPRQVRRSFSPETAYKNQEQSRPVVRRHVIREFCALTERERERAVLVQRELFSDLRLQIAIFSFDGCRRLNPSQRRRPWLLARAL